MKKFIFLLLLLVGCAGPLEEVTTYTSSNNTVKLKVRHSNGGSSVSVEITTAAEAKAYKERLKRIIYAVEEFEKELLIREKTN